MGSKTASFYLLFVAVILVVAAAKLELEDEDNFGEWGYSIVRPLLDKILSYQIPFHASLH